MSSEQLKSVWTIQLLLFCEDSINYIILRKKFVVPYHSCTQPLDVREPHSFKCIQQLDVIVVQYHNCTVVEPYYEYLSSSSLVWMWLFMVLIKKLKFLFFSKYWYYIASFPCEKWKMGCEKIWSSLKCEVHHISELIFSNRWLD